MANIRRPIVGFNQPVNPLQGGKAGSKDQRRFISGNVAGDQWDITQFSQDRAALLAHPPPQYSEAHALRPVPDGVVRTIPTRVNYVRWRLTTGAAEVPVLLVPRNPNRVSLQFTAYNVEGIGYSWGFPELTPTSVPLGNLLQYAQTLPIMAGTVPINDLWVWTQNPGLIQIAYEGVEALEANP